MKVKRIPDRLVIGCGRKARKGFLNIDIVDLEGVDKVVDLDKIPYDLPRKHFKEIVADNVIEHLESVPLVMKELHSLMKTNGVLKIRVPHFTYSAAYTDPTHKHFFGYNTFEFFVKGTVEHDFYFDFHFRKIWKKLHFGKRFAIWNYFIEPLANFFPSVYENTVFRSFPAEELEVWLTK